MEFVIHPSSAKYRIRLDISDIEFDGKDKIEPYLIFNGGTYDGVRRYDNDKGVRFGCIFNATNWYFRNTTDENRITVAKYFAAMNYAISTKMPKVIQGVTNFTEQLGGQFLEMIKNTDIIPAFRNYAGQVTLQDTSKFGTRPQDTEALTFTEPEMREMMVLACCCKLAAPIFSEIINNLPEQTGDNGKSKFPKHKEAKCANFLNPLITEIFPGLINKLQFYIHHIVSGLCDKQDTAAIHEGWTINTRTNSILSLLLVRNYVVCELEISESNIVRYTDAMVRTTVTTQDDNAHHSQVRPRPQANSMMSSDESGNASQIEIDSLVSVGTMDIPIMIAASIDSVIQAFRVKYLISSQDFQQALDWFHDHPIYQSPLNVFVAHAVYRKYIGGGRSVEMTDAENFTKLVVMLQFIALSMGYIDLACSLTATRSSTVKVQRSLEEENFRRQAPTLSHYCAYRSLFADSSIQQGGSEWDKQMGEIIDDLTTSIYLNNVPEFILEQTQENETEPLSAWIKNGAAIAPNTRITEEACALIRIYTDDETHAQ